MKLSHIDSSALVSQSVSRQLSAEAVAELQRPHPGIGIRYQDLAAQSLPRYAGGRRHRSRRSVHGSEMLDELLPADVVVIGAPTYSFSIPSQLKAWLDRIAVEDLPLRLQRL